MIEAGARHELRQQLLAELARVNRALAAPARLELLELLAQAERSVEVLAELAGLTVANTSQHLRVLRHCGLVVSRRDGQFVRYRLPGLEPLRLLTALHDIAVHSSPALGRLLAEQRRHVDSLEPLSAAELHERHRDGAVVVVDVRPAEEYAAGHISDAINMPLPHLVELAPELPVDREIVAYCRGVLSVMSIEAVSRLRATGRAARRLAYGFPEWRMAGLPVSRLAH